jgi:hypothetical protein
MPAIAALLVIRPLACDGQSARTFECLGFCRINMRDAKLQAEGKMNNADCAERDAQGDAKDAGRHATCK